MVRGTGTTLKERILAEARRVLEAEGMRALSTRRLAKAVGCTATSLYIYFDNKEALLQALLEEGFEMLGDQLEACAANEGTAERPRSLARTYIDFGLANPAWYELMFLLPADHLGAPYPPEKYRQGRKHLERLCKALTASPACDLKTAQDLTEATLLWSSLHGLVSLLLAGRVDAALDHQALIDATLDRAFLSLNASETAPVSSPLDLSS